MTDDRLILLLRDLAALAELRRDSSPFAIVPRSMRGGSPLGSMISKSSNAPADATDAQVRRLTNYLLTGHGQTATQVRGALLQRIAEEPLPGDPAAEYDPAHAQEVGRRIEGAPPRVRCVLDALRHVPTPYDPREAVCQRLADVLGETRADNKTSRAEDHAWHTEKIRILSGLTAQMQGHGEKLNAVHADVLHIKTSLGKD